MTWTREESIDYNLNIGFISESSRLPLCKALAYLPDSVLEQVYKKTVFIIRGDEEALGSYYSFSHFCFHGCQGFIVLDERLWKKSEIEIAFLVAHEVAHALTDDRPRTLEEATMVIGKVREIDADRRALKWLSKHFKKDDLLKQCSYYGKIK